ncbi:aminotransferase class V-fold PLP-dependent enzyme [Enterocloster citroniae]|uniref:Aminotransferase class V domain-containing protein n=1 Tax=[Clostridium] citroniae WAL-17108 TaxID=742733 RepID=G5HKE2_9FIRM|nr:aminotransferase class V-fold PLP-dependent enzyme [Enterocloster citroniae]EHE98242.1 hypothetical protein HMPREF9469_03054 [ [[Clostridium] citroniae WAL-17108]MCC3385377.1 aminotransferase class V-fold PLP-dependent enzyme [Enterocloster citroniae]MCD8280026.1 aminotransferase class V-fold PLP-dependent enzyme [Enterocloster citroniae]
MIYLDNAATTFPKPEAVYQAMDEENRHAAVNAGRGSYKAAKVAAELISDTKKRLAKLFNCDGLADIVFVPSVTHAINQVINGLDITTNTIIYLSPYEHNAVARTVENVRNNAGCTVMFLPIKEDTLEINVEETEYLFHKNPPNIVIMNVISNVTGYRLPVETVFKRAKQFGAITIADVAQASGLIDIDMNEFFADILCFAGHKTLYGPFGIGGFAISKQVELYPVFTGGTGSNSLNLSMPERGAERYEAASPNIVAIAGLNASLKILDQREHERKIRELTRYLIDKLEEIPSVILMGIIDADRCYGIVSFVVEGYDSNEVGSILDDEYDIAVRTGYHCAPFIHKYLDDVKYGGTVRIGVGMFNTESDIDKIADALQSL